MADAGQPCKLKSMDDFYDFIKEVRETIETQLKTMRDATQAELDDFIKEEINGPVNEKLARKRQELINSLQEQYKSLTKQNEEAEKITGPMKKLLDADLSIDTVVGIVGDIIGLLKEISLMLIQAYVAALQFPALVTAHALKISEEINKLENIKVEKLNTKALKIKCEGISLSDVTGGGDQKMPAMEKLKALKKGINKDTDQFLKDIKKSGDGEESIFKTKSCSCQCTPPDVPLPF